MRKRFAFEFHHPRALGFIPPGVTPGNTNTETGTTSAALSTTPAAAPATPNVNRATSTPAAATTITQGKKTDTQDTQDNAQSTRTTATTQVAAASTSNTLARTTSTVPTATPAAATTQIGANTVAAVNTDTSKVQEYTVTRTTKTASLSPSSSPALPSPSAAEDNGPSVGTIAGYAAATLAGIAVISIFAIWMIRRRRRRQEDADIDAAPFNRQSWLRNSTMIHDDAPIPAATAFPPPRREPDMIDRSFNATPVTNYAGMNHYPQNNFGYATQPSYQPGAVIFSPSSAKTSFGPGGSPATSLPFSPGYDAATPNPFEQQQGGYTEVTRGGPPSPFNPYHQEQQFDNIQRQMTPSVPPAPAEDRPLSPRAASPQVEAAPPDPAATAGPAGARVPAYPELSPAPTSAQGQVVEVRASTYMGQATPVQYGFTEGPQSSVAAAPSIQPPAVLQPAAGRALTRPETVYDTEDAYGGI